MVDSKNLKLSNSNIKIASHHTQPAIVFRPSNYSPAPTTFSKTIATTQTDTMTTPVLKRRSSRFSSIPTLPPTLGKVGSILFFVTLFSLAHKDSTGYEEFRKCHGNCTNGLLHFVGMPPAVSGVFMIVRAASNSPSFTRALQWLVTSYYLYLYTTYEQNPWSPWLFYVLYMTIWECLYHLLYPRKWTRTAFAWYGIMLITVNVGGLETLGHGVFEHHHR